MLGSTTTPPSSRSKHSPLVAAYGPAAYPAATELLITADGGGSNGYRVRLWKLELQRLGG